MTHKIKVKTIINSQNQSLSKSQHYHIFQTQIDGSYKAKVAVCLWNGQRRQRMSKLKRFSVVKHLEGKTQVQQPNQVNNIR